GPGATLSGASLIIDTSGSIRPGTGVTLDAGNISIAAKTINFGTTLASAGFNIDSNISGQLAQATNLTLRSLRTMTFTGNVDFSLGEGAHLILDASALTGTTGVVKLGAGQLDWINTTPGQTPNAAGSATLELTASATNGVGVGTIGIGAGTKSLSGFANTVL